MLVFGIALIVYCFKPSWIMTLWLITVPLLAPIIVLKNLPAGDADAVYTFLNSIWGLFNRLFLLIIGYELLIKRHRIPTNVIGLFKVLLLLIVYLVIHNIITHFDITILYQNIVSVVYVLSPLFVFLLNKDSRPHLKHLYVAIIVVYIVQLIWIPLNQEGIFAYAARFEEILENHDEAALMPGTFIRSNGMSDYVAITYLFICIDFFYRRKLPLLLFVLTTLMVIGLLVAAGTRMPVVVTVFAFFSCLFLFSRGKKEAVLTLLIISIVFLCYMGNDSKDDNAGGDRIREGITEFANSKTKKGSDESTVRLSSQLIEEYFWNSPIIGHGNFYKGEDKAYKINDRISTLSLFRGDATFALYLVEFGVIGMILFLLYFYKVISYSTFFFSPKDRHKIMFVVLFFMFLFSITEGGLFVTSNYTYLFGYTFGLKRYYDEL